VHLSRMQTRGMASMVYNASNGSEAQWEQGRSHNFINTTRVSFAKLGAYCYENKSTGGSQILRQESGETRRPVCICRKTQATI
jgi:hypothetical protein